MFTQYRYFITDDLSRIILSQRLAIKTSKPLLKNVSPTVGVGILSIVDLQKDDFSVVNCSIHYLNRSILEGVWWNSIL